jgi:hypothetical protein
MVTKKRELRNRGIDVGSVQYEAEIAQLDGETIEHLFWGCRKVKGVKKKNTLMKWRGQLERRFQ